MKFGRRAAEQRLSGQRVHERQASISHGAGSKVSIDGRLMGKTPLVVSDLLPGKHEVTVEGDSGSVSTMLMVEAGQTTELEVPVYAGWASVLSPVQLDILLEGKLVGSTEIEKLMLKPGKHTLELVNESLGYRGSVEVRVLPGATTSVSVVPKTPVTVEAPEGTELAINGENMGTANAAGGPAGDGGFVMRYKDEERRRVVPVTMSARDGEMRARHRRRTRSDPEPVAPAPMPLPMVLPMAFGRPRKRAESACWGVAFLATRFLAAGAAARPPARPSSRGRLLCGPLRRFAALGAAWASVALDAAAASPRSARRRPSSRPTRGSGMTARDVGDVVPATRRPARCSSWRDRRAARPGSRSRRNSPRAGQAALDEAGEAMFARRSPVAGAGTALVWRRYAASASRHPASGTRAPWVGRPAAPDRRPAASRRLNARRPRPRPPSRGRVAVVAPIASATSIAVVASIATVTASPVRRRHPCAAA